MSKHNNNLSPSLSKRCRCGRYITIGEDKGRGYTTGQYECPTCQEGNRELRKQRNLKEGKPWWY